MLLSVETLKLRILNQVALHLFMKNTQTWYIVKLLDGHCEIVSDEQVNVELDAEAQERWGSFSSQAEAIASRVGLIRTGKCQPV